MNPITIIVAVVLGISFVIGIYYFSKQSKKSPPRPRSGATTTTENTTTPTSSTSSTSSAAIQLTTDTVLAQLPEAFCVERGGYNLSREEAKALCEEYGARQATYADIVHAQKQGADWCRAAWVSDADKRSAWPVQVNRQHCTASDAPNGIATWIYTDQNNVPKAAANCFGIKPSKTAVKKEGDVILPWSQPSNLEASVLPYRWSFWRG